MDMYDKNSSDCGLLNCSDTLNLTEEEYMQNNWGPKYLPLSEIVPLSLTYIVIFVTGVFGNVVTCIVINRNSAMHTVTNYYLFNLAISDLLLLMIGLPTELSVYWEQYPWRLGEAMCKIRAFVSETSSYVSILTIVAFAFERYLAICHPLRHIHPSGSNRAMSYILGSWMIAFVCATPFAHYTTVNYLEYPPRSGRFLKESAVCAMLPSNMPDLPLYELSCIIFFLVPFMVILFLCVRMGCKIRSNPLERTIEGSVHGETQVQSRKIIIRILGAVVITFFIGWAPFHLQRLLFAFEVRNIDNINKWLFPVAGVFYYLTATVNPILYNLMSAKYREAFKKTLCCSPRNSFVITVSGSGSTRESRMVRGRSVQKYHTSEGGDQENHPTMKTNDATTKNKNLSSVEFIPSPVSHEGKKSSYVVQAGNGRQKCETSEKERTPSNVARI